MSSLHETFATPSPRNKKAGLVALGASAAVLGGIFFGPGAIRSYHEAQAIEQKRGPAKAYVTQTLGELVLGDQQLAIRIGDHECNRGPRYAPGERSRYCKVAGESTYVIKAGDFLDAYMQASDVLQQHAVPRGAHTISFEGQDIDVIVDFTVRGAQSYNNSYERSDTDPTVPEGAYVVEYDAAAYTVNTIAPDYPYNDDMSP